MKISRSFAYRALYSKSKGCCYYCSLSLDEESCLIDQIMPVILGGEEDFDNLVIACKSCAASKRGRIVDDFKLRMSFEYAGCPHKFSTDQIKWLLNHFTDDFVKKAQGFQFFGETINE